MLVGTIAMCRDLPPFVVLQMWVVRDPAGAGFAGAAGLVMLNTEDNRHLGQVQLNVRAAARRQGLGGRLLAAVAAAAAAADRRLLVTTASSPVPAGGAFAARWGAAPALEEIISQLDLAQLDRGLIADWRAAAVPGFTFGRWNGPYPEDELAAIAELLTLANQAPRGDVDMEDFVLTPEQVRQQEASLAARRIERWTYYARETATGALAGYTATEWNPTRPAVLMQQMTAVWPRYRGHGLGRRLKAEMIAAVLAERPDVQFIRTGNATVNAPMLAINRALGFRPYFTETIWQVEVAPLRAALAAAGYGA